MLRRMCIMLAGLGWASLAGWSGAQPPDLDAADGERRLPPLPILRALDADGDGEISTAEIDGAAAALKSLDKNEDGKLEMDEVRPDFGRWIRRHRGGAGDDGPGGVRHGDRRRGDGPPHVDNEDAPDDDSDRRDGDSREGRHRRHWDHRRSPGDAPPPRHAGPPGPPSHGFGPPPGFGPPTGFGPPSPEEFVERAMKFDKNGDGQLSRDELEQLAEKMSRRAHHDRHGPRAERPDEDEPETESDSES